MLLRSDPKERLWYWSYQGNRLFMELEESIRVRVLSESFAHAPTPAAKDAGRKAPADTEQGSALKPSRSPYTLMVSAALQRLTSCL